MRLNTLKNKRKAIALKLKEREKTSNQMFEHGVYDHYKMDARTQLEPSKSIIVVEIQRSK